MHGDAGGVALLLSVFRHADAWHLVSNMVGLAIVAPRVARVVGAWRLALLLLVAGVAANACAAWMLHRPVIGASGAVAGVMAAHLRLFPRSRLARPIGLWLVLQVVFASFALDFGGIAWPAHLAGAAVGALLAHWMCGSHMEVARGR